MAEINYPQGCRPVVIEGLGTDELIRRLKTLAHTLQAMGQDEGMYQQYIPLALHLAEDHFLTHESKDVQLLIACCIADVLRVYAPEAPYKDADQVKQIFLFLIRQLAGLKDPKDPAFKRYFYLLENLAYVKSFNMCFELEDCQEIFCALFSLMFKIINDEHSGKVKSFMLDVLYPLITESDIVSNELLDIILMNIVEPNKTQKKNAYNLAKDLIIKCSETLEPYIQAFFNQVLILGREERSLQICSKVYDLIYELNHICPSVLLSVLPQLECKLKSTHENERLHAVALLARMFSEKGSQLAMQHQHLWRAFQGRFNDISVSIRIKCVQYSMHFLLNHPELRKDITETLKLRQHDADENVRYEVVMAIVSTAKKDFEIVSDSEDLLEFVKERTLDKKFKIRKEAMTGLAIIYKKHLSDADVPQATKKAVTWIKDKILHGYYMAGMEDRLLVERLLNTCLVPYQLSAEERMKKLYHLLGTIDDHASRAFVELQKHQLAVRRAVMEWVNITKRSNIAPTSEMNSKIQQISRFLPDPMKVQEFLQQFGLKMKHDPTLLADMETIVQPTVSCKECADTITAVLKKLGPPVMTNLLYNTIKMLLERVSSVIIDADAIRILIGYVTDCLNGGNVIEEVGLNPNNAGEKGLKLLVILSFIFGPHFFHNDILMKLVNMLRMDDEMVAPLVLSTFTFLGRCYKPLCEVAPEVCKMLAPICKNFAESGTPKQAKNAIRCLFVNMTNIHDSIFPEIIERIKMSLTPSCENYRTAIVTLGHIAYNLPDKYQIQIKNLVSKKIVKELLVKDYSEPRNDLIEGDWCREDQLPEETRCRLEGLKCMARWLLGLKTDNLSAQKTFRMLNAFIMNKGDLLQQNKLSKAEMSWLRLQAGCSILKICEQKGVGDQYNAEQFYNLSQLMVDDVLQVREAFGQKLHKGLGRGIPNKCLPLDFMGLYALAGKEQDKRLKVTFKNYMLMDISKRRDYVKTMSLNPVDRVTDQLPFILPDYMLVFAVPVLAHDPAFTSHSDIQQLKVIQQCLWFILEPLLVKNEFYSYGFYKSLVEKMKNCKDSLRPEDENMNCKLWAVCDLAFNVIYSKTTNFDMKEFPAKPRIPSMYFKHLDEMQVNVKNYLPPEMQISMLNAVKGKGLYGNTTNERPRRNKGKQKEVGIGPNETDARPAEASETRIQLPGIEDEIEEPPTKRALRESDKINK